MKKFLVVLLSLGLIVAFGMTASAQGPSIKVSGQYYVSGVYQDNGQLLDTGGYSGATVFNRFRMKTDLGIAEGLTFSFRFDSLEKQWGQTDWRSGLTASGIDNSNSRVQSPAASNFVPQSSAAFAKATYSPGVSNTQKIQENFEMEQAYVTFKTAIGVFQVGYQPVYQWALDWMNSGSGGPRAMFNTQLGPLTLGVHWDKIFEVDTSNVKIGTVAKFYQNKTDADNDAYGLTGIYKWKGGEAGLLYKYYQLDSKKPEDAGGYVSRFHLLSPYFKATIGPVYLEGEAQHFWGKAMKFENGVTPDIDYNTWAAYIMGRYNFGPAFVGGLFSYASGDDYTDLTTSKTTSIAKSTSWNPTLIVANDDEASWHPSRVQYNESPKGNMIWYQINGGFKPTPKLDLFTSLTYITVADKHYAPNMESGSNRIGTEFDITATYKIFDQLTYMVGFGYLWAGDNWKDNPATCGGSTGLAAVPGNVGNDYLLVNKLDLQF